jgi:hypothetical protein
MTLGALGVAVSMAVLSRVDAGSGYLTGILPGIILFGLALSLMVAPLTATVMAAAPARHAGVASGINNAVARTASLLAVAVLPPLAGLTGDAYTDPAAFADGYRTAMAIAAGLAAVGAVTAFLTVSDRLSGDRDPAPRSSEPGRHDHHCAVDAPPLRTAAPATDASGSRCPARCTCSPRSSSAGPGHGTGRAPSGRPPRRTTPGRSSSIRRSGRSGCPACPRCSSPPGRSGGVFACVSPCARPAGASGSASRGRGHVQVDGVSDGSLGWTLLAGGRVETYRLTRHGDRYRLEVEGGDHAAAVLAGLDRETTPLV